MHFTLVVAPVFLILFILEQVFPGKVNQPTSYLECFLYAISFRIFISYWRRTENEHINNYCDNQTSKVFLK